MRRSLAVALLLLFPLFLGAANNPAPINLDFESGAAGELPPGWISPTTAMGYTAVLTTETPKQGKQCVLVSGSPKPAEDGRPVFGNVMQRIDATPYRGKRVRFRGAVRVQGESVSAGLWMRVDRPEKQPGSFENMQDRPVRSGNWAYYEITGDVAGDAEVLNIGMIVEREGSAWLDDVTIAIAPKAEMRSAPPRAITPRGVENLIAFTRLFGIVRHFHPSDEASSADWMAIAVNGAAAAESAQTASELAARLEAIFVPIAPSVQVYRSNAPPRTTSIARPADAQRILVWENTGFGPGNTSRGEKIYSSTRTARAVTAAADPRLPDPQQPLKVDLGGGVSASIPLAVYVDATRTLPRASREALAPAKGEYTGNDRATRIGAVVMVWNVLQHFYPYFDVVDVDWRAELRTALTAAATDRDELAFLRTLRRMIASLHDGHGSVSLATAIDRASLPILWRVVNDALVITAVDASVSGLSAGDEVVAIGGRAALDVLREAETLVSGATPQWRRWNALDQMIAGNVGSQVVLTIRNADAITHNVTLTRAIATERPTEKRPERIAELKPGFWYVDLTRINDADFEASIGKLAAARGIAFDMRGYPRPGVKPLQPMIGEGAQSARWNVPLLRRPDFQGVEWVTEGRWDLSPAQPRFTKNIVFLTDGRAISYAESWMGIIEAYKLDEIVGETTAGTNGNINIVQLPGGYRVVFTGMKVLKHDGSRHHGVGIAPTIPVSPTLTGIRAGRDEQLESAVEALESALRER